MKNINNSYKKALINQLTQLYTMRAAYALFGCLLVAMFLVPMISAAEMSRSLSSTIVAPGGTLTVSIVIDASGAEYYVIDDVFPEGWEVIDAGVGSAEHQGHWKYVLIEGAVDTEFVYTLRAPSEEGNYSFSGEYMFGGMESSVEITGDSSVVVAESVPIVPDTTTIMIILVIVIAGIGAFVFMKKK